VNASENITAVTGWVAVYVSLSLQPQLVIQATAGGTVEDSQTRGEPRRATEYS
jgi:hypothetical protein